MTRLAPSLRLATAVSIAATVTASSLHAQAVCSAPHSSPTLSRAGIGILPAGSGWVQVTGYYTRSTEFYDPNGNTRPLLTGGETSTSSMFVTAAGGIGRGLELWLQIPVHRVALEDHTGEVSRIAVGDPRISLRAGGALIGLDALPVAIRAGIKLPGSEFPVDTNEVPISEGQTDVELALEAGRRLAGAYPLHIVGWAGYRWRFEDTRRQRKPGNERFVRLGAGGPIGPAWSSLRWDLAVEGLWGAGLEQQGLVLDSARRRLVQVLPTVAWKLGGAELELTGRFNVTGRNLPSGSAVSAGVVVPWIL